MVYSGELLRLNGKTFKFIISYKIGRNKLWSSDTGRTMSGAMKGSLVGNFPKIILNIEPLDGDNMSELEKILDSPIIEIEYYNIKFKCMCRGNFYANNYEEDLLLAKKLMYKPFTVDLISMESEENHVRFN